MERNLPVMSGKRAFLDLLKQEGVKVMFGNPGTTELPLMDAFAVEHDIRYILGLQEAALMAMADGYAQATRNAAMVNLHSATGLGHAMGSIFTAYKNRPPLVITAGQQAATVSSSGGPAAARAGNSASGKRARSISGPGGPAARASRRRRGGCPPP